MRVACVNQDPGIQPDRHKGAAVHLAAMRAAFASLGADVIALDEADGGRLRQRLETVWREAPIDLVYERYALGRSTGGGTYSANSSRISA